MDISAGVRPFRQLAIGGNIGYLWVNVGPGGDTRFASTDQVFTPAQAPGIDRQSDFIHQGVFAHLDYRDNPSGPRSGGFYAVKYSRYLDQNFGAYSFERFDIEAKQFIPFFTSSACLHSVPKPL